MAEVILSNRMQALTDMVTPGTVITDVGCDHGFVSVYLVQKGLSPRVIAMDVRSGPLERAREHIREYGLQDRIETRLSDGLHGLKTGEANGMICAGMGGPLMEKILTEGREQAQGFAELILQPQSEIPHFRTFLMDEGYLLLDENIIYEEGKYYFMMKVRWLGAMTDDGEECVCVQSISYSLLCRWFRASVLPQDKELETALFHRMNAKRCAVCRALFTPGSNRAKYCPECACSVSGWQSYSCCLSLCSSSSFNCLRFFFSSVFSSFADGSETCSSA